MFVQKLNAVCGQREWCYVEDGLDESDLKNEIARSTYAGMLHDNERNEKYHLAIKEAVQEMQKHGEKAMVLDIGTGTGILAMMAAKENADSVVACEVFQPMAKIAEKIIEANGYANEISLLPKRSTEIQVGSDLDMQEKANILVTEIFDTELLGEGVLPTLRHAQRNLLQSQSITIPHAANVFVCLAECEFLWSLHKLRSFGLQDESELKLMKQLKNCQGLASAFEVHIDEVKDLKPLSTPLEAIRFNFNDTPDLQKNDHGCYDCYCHRITATTTGTIHCIVMWWEIILDKNDKIVLSMVPKIFADDPDKVKWRDHWMQAVYFLPDPISVNEGDVVQLDIQHDDYSFWFHVRPLNSSLSTIVPERPSCTCGLHTTWSRERFLMNNDSKLNAVFESTFEKLKKKNHCVFIGDVSLVGFFAAGVFNKITYFECGQFSRSFLEKLIALNKLTDKVNMKNITDLDESLLSSIDQIDVLAGEPFFSSSLLPWDHLSFWYLISPILEALQKPLVVIPMKAVLKIVAVQFDELWKVKSPVRKAEGFNLEIFDEVIAASLTPETIDDDTYFYEAEPYSVWEYNRTILSETKEVAVFDLTKPVPTEDITYNGDLKVQVEGKCNAIVAWMDFCLDEENSWTTGLTTTSEWVEYSKQGVHLIRLPMMVSQDKNIKYRVLFNAKTGKILFGLPNISTS